MLPINKVKEIISRYETLEKTLSQTDIDKNTYVKNSKEYSSIGDIIIDVKNYIKMVEDKEGSQKILEDKSADKELKEMAELELNEIKEKIGELETKIKIFMLPKDEADEKNAIIEIRAGTGGLEASLFAGDLFEMYQKVASNNGWKTEIISISDSDAGGYKEVVFSVTGKNVFSKLKFESGVHRVQRVPKTETQGRVHTSAATVAVLPEAEDVDVKIDENELRIDVFRSSGPGGQSVNTTDSAVRITHIPSGIVVSQQDEKSQHKNKAKALKILRSKLYELERSKLEKERSSTRKSQIGSGDRSERIRTYNFPQGRVTDHRINLTLHKLSDFLSGDVFSEISDALQIQFQEQQLES
ncbi:MAG: peptide chain release factor 1 [Pelagibacteraceae bacterium]|nr:peptide chain release factor 1 [Pelagibacteraceae bacterium]MCI5078751.1 peptide chain release factor 1 [Pelagibacteraceae bacterium]